MSAVKKKHRGYSNQFSFPAITDLS